MDHISYANATSSIHLKQIWEGMSYELILDITVISQSSIHLKQIWEGMSYELILDITNDPILSLVDQMYPKLTNERMWRGSCGKQN
jgi:hypothetical protein